MEIRGERKRHAIAHRLALPICDCPLLELAPPCLFQEERKSAGFKLIKRAKNDEVGAAGSLRPILQLGILHRLPLHIIRRITPASLQRLHMVNDVDWTGAPTFAGRGGIDDFS